MPELPEVETTVRGLNARVRGKTITDAWTSFSSPHAMHRGTAKDPAFFRAFRSCVKGASILRAHRRAKNVLIDLSTGDTVVIHMKMTGHLLAGRYEKRKGAWVALEPGPLQEPINQHIRLVFSFSDGTHLALSDMRKFAKVILEPTEGLSSSPHLAHIGPEPLDEAFSADDLYGRLARRKNGAVKSVLMDQTVVAGIGNIYSDEILWACGIHPEEPVKNLSRSDVRAIHRAARALLEKGIGFGGDSLSDYRTVDGTAGRFQGEHRAYRLTGAACSKRGCAGTIRRKVVGGRSAHFCDAHQARRGAQKAPRLKRPTRSRTPSPRSSESPRRHRQA
jgi:formamidopyrimidine-DNA glycosylase